VGLEVGRRWTFASALDWPGWCRRGKGTDGAVESLLEYAERYRRVAGAGFEVGPVEVVGEVAGDASTDFGAPGTIGPWDHAPLLAHELDRQLGLLVASWDYLDGVLATSPARLRKGPRGGGRDRDQIARHVQEAERAYSSRAGRRVAPRTEWPGQRRALLEVLRQGAGNAKWPARYVVRRSAWHVLDHAWEIEDKTG
jgi:hypothetical protein